jgi:hypothetical protein
LAVSWEATPSPRATACHTALDSAVPAEAKLRNVEGSTPTARTSLPAMRTVPARKTTTPSFEDSAVSLAIAAGEKVRAPVTRTSGRRRVTSGLTASATGGRARVAAAVAGGVVASGDASARSASRSGASTAFGVPPEQPASATMPSSAAQRPTRAVVGRTEACGTAVTPGWVGDGTSATRRSHQVNDT